MTSKILSTHETLMCVAYVGTIANSVGPSIYQEF